MWNGISRGYTFFSIVRFLQLASLILADYFASTREFVSSFFLFFPLSPFGFGCYGYAYDFRTNGDILFQPRRDWDGWTRY